MEFSDMTKLIRGLSPELQEKAKNCRNFDEFLTFADKHDISLPAEMLRTVSGGSNQVWKKVMCSCGRHDFSEIRREHNIQKNTAGKIMKCEYCETRRYYLANHVSGKAGGDFKVVTPEEYRSYFSL